MVSLTLMGRLGTLRPQVALSQVTLLQGRWFSSLASPGGTVNIFDRNAKRIQRNRAASLPDPGLYDYLKDAVAAQVVDRVCDVARLVD